MKLLFWAATPLFIALLFSSWTAGAASNQCAAVYSLDRPLPWNRDEVLQFGMQKGALLSKQRSSTRPLSSSEANELGLSGDSQSRFFYNLSGSTGKWAGRWQVGSIRSAKFEVEEFNQDGDLFYHAIIRIQFDAKNPVKIYEQRADGLGREQITDEFVLSAGFQNLEGKEVTAFGKDLPITFFILTGERQAEREKRKAIKLDSRELKMKPEEIQKILENYLNLADTDGGQRAFDFCKNNCTNNLVDVVLRSVTEAPVEISNAQHISNTRMAGRVLKAMEAYGLVDP